MNSAERSRKKFFEKFLERRRLVRQVMRRVPKNLKGKKLEEFISARLAKLRRRMKEAGPKARAARFAENYYTVSGRVGDFIVTRTYSHGDRRF